MIIPAVLILASILLFIPATGNSITNAGDKAIEKISLKPILILAVTATVLFFFYRQGAYFLGDGYLRITITQDKVLFSAGQVLSNFIHTGFYTLLNPLTGISAVEVWQYFSIVSGFIVIISSWPLLLKITGDRKQSLIILLAILAAGNVQLYFGYVESYTFAAVFILLFLLTGMKMLKERKFSILPTVFFIFGALMATSVSVLFPALVYSYFSTGREKRIRNIAVPVLLIAVSLAIFLAIIILSGVGFDKFWAQLNKVSHILPLFSTPDSYGIFSVGHLNDIINEILLTVPAVIALPYIFRKLKHDLWDNSLIFLLVSAFCTLFFMLVFRPDIGLARDWDLFSIITYPITLFIVFALLKTGEKAGEMVVFIIMISILHTVPWIIVNSNETMSLERAEKMNTIEYLPDHSKAVTYDILRQFYQERSGLEAFLKHQRKDFDRGDLGKAARFAELSYKYENNPRYLFDAAYLYLKNGNTEKAVPMFLRVTKSDFRNKHLAYTNLTQIALENRDYNSAIKYMNAVINLFPDKEEPYINLGTLYYNLGQARNAYSMFSKAKKIDPANTVTLDYLSEISYGLGKFDKAIDCYRSLLKMNSDNPLIYNNIASCYVEKGIRDSAEYFLNEAVRKGLAPKQAEALRNKIKSKFNK